MSHAWKFVAIGLQLAVMLGWQVDGAQALTTETYLFRDSFAPSEGAGNVLVPVSNSTGTIVTDGPDFVNGSFVSETISNSACASTPTIRAWSFPVSGGLRHDNTTPTVVTGSYSISMLMRYDPMDTEYARLVDFSNSTLDTGIYKLDAGVSFYPVGEYAPGSFVQDQDVFVTITRDATTKDVSLYINGIASGVYTDVDDLYAPSATALYFLMDNTTGSAAVLETDPGVIAYLQVRDTPMSSQEVVASLSAICDVVSTAECMETPDGATFTSIFCRLDALRGRVDDAPGLGAFQAKLAKSLGTARARATEAQALCGQPNLKKTRKRLQQSAKALSQYVHRLAGLPARKKLDDALRQEFLQGGQAIVPDLKTLRAQVACPSM